MDSLERNQLKQDFKQKFSNFLDQLKDHVSTENEQWTIKGFIDVFQNIYTISADTKIVSKILEIHLLPKIIEFAQINNFTIVLPQHQNYYPDLSFVQKDDERVKFAVDLKTSYRLPENPDFCNGFTLGSHGKYFTERNTTKNIQFPYNDYLGHFCLGIIYSRITSTDESEVYNIDEIGSITSVISDFQFFICEKWQIASDSSGSGNTANIGSINKISDILSENGMFKNLGETWFDDYWMNYNKITMSIEDNTQNKDKGTKTKKITKLKDFLRYRGQNPNLVNPRAKQSTKPNNPP